MGFRTLHRLLELYRILFQRVTFYVKPPLSRLLFEHEISRHSKKITLYTLVSSGATSSLLEGIGALLLVIKLLLQVLLNLTLAFKLSPTVGSASVLTTISYVANLLLLIPLLVLVPLSALYLASYYVLRQSLNLALLKRLDKKALSSCLYSYFHLVHTVYLSSDWTIENIIVMNLAYKYVKLD